MEEITYKSKTTENVVRGFIYLLPKGEAIDKILFSEKDARDSAEINTIFTYIKSKLSKQVIDQLEKLEDIKNIASIIHKEVGDINEIVNQFYEYIENKKNFDKEKKGLIEESRNEVLNGIESLSNKLDTLLRNQRLDFEFLSSLFKSLFDNYEKKMKELDFEEVLKNIKSIRDFRDYKKIDNVFQDGLLSYEAEINLKLGNDQVAEYLTEQLISNKNYSVRVCNYLLYYATLRKNSVLFEDILSKYKTLEVEQNKIIGKEVFWLYFSGQHIELLNLLCTDSSYSVIKENYKDSTDFNFFVGMSLFELKKYYIAKTFFNKAFEKGKNVVHRYYYLLGDAFKIIDRRSALFLITEAEREILIEILKELSNNSFSEYFGKAPIQLKQEYWIQRITIALHIKYEIGLDEYNKCPDELKDREGVKLILADVLFFNDNFEEANKILIELYTVTKDYNYITKILSSYLQTGKYEEVIHFSEDIKYFDDEGIIYSLIIEAYSKMYNNEKVIEFAKEKIKQCKYPIYIYRTIGDLYYNISNYVMAKNYYTKMIESIPEDNYAPRLIFAHHLKSNNFIELSLQCLNPYLSFSYEAQKLFVYDAIKPQNDQYYEMASEIIDKNILKDNDKVFWIGNKIELEFNRKKYNTSLKYLKQLYAIENNSKVAYKIAYLKILLGEKDDILELANKLENEPEPNFIMMAANCYNFIGDYEKAESVSLKSFAVQGNSFDENLYYLFIRINLIPKPGIPDIAEIDEVSNDCTLLLESESEQIWIGITSKQELLIKENDFVFADTYFFFRNDENIIHLIGNAKNDKVNFRNKNWIIKDIWKIKTRIVRFCLMEYTNKLPGSKIFQLIKIDESSPVKSMMPILVEAEIYEKQIISNYNFKNNIGLPLHQISIKKGRNLFDVIMFLLNTPNQLFFTGEVNLLNIKERRIVLSPSSIIILSLIDILEVLVNKYKNNLILLESTKNYFLNIVDKMNTEESAIAMTMGIDGGQITGIDYTKEIKRKRINYFNKIIQDLRSISVTSIAIAPEELDDKSKYIDVISRQDFENLRFACDNNCIYLVDDLFVRNIRGLFDQNIDVLNTVSIMYVLLDEDIDLLLEKIEQLSKGGYNYLFNLNTLILLTEKLFNKYKIIGNKSNYGIFLRIIHNALSQQYIFLNNLKIIISYLNYLYYLNADNRSKYLVTAILRELWNFINLFNFNPNILIDEIIFICKGDKNKILFFHEILKKIDIE